MSLAGGDQLLDKGLEHLHDIEFAASQGGGIVGHRAVGDARQPVGVEPGKAQIVLQAQPRGRHLADRRDPPAVQIGKREIGARLTPDQKKRVARHRLADADEVAIGPGFVKLVDPHRPAPADIDRAGEKPVRRRARRRRADELDLDPLALERTQRKAGVERRVEQPAQRFL